MLISETEDIQGSNRLSTAEDYAAVNTEDIVFPVRGAKARPGQERCKATAQAWCLLYLFRL